MTKREKAVILAIVSLIIVITLMIITAIQTNNDVAYAKALQNEDMADIEYSLPYIDETVKQEALQADWETYTVTAYCACSKCCGKCDGITASGVKAQEGITIAADKRVLPIGTMVEIDGVGIRTVQDTGVKGKHIDLFFADHGQALQFGKQNLKVRIINDERL